MLVQRDAFAALVWLACSVALCHAYYIAEGYADPDQAKEVGRILYALGINVGCLGSWVVVGWWCRVEPFRLLISLSPARWSRGARVTAAGLIGCAVISPFVLWGMPWPDSPDKSLRVTIAEEMVQALTGLAFLTALLYSIADPWLARQGVAQRNATLAVLVLGALFGALRPIEVMLCGAVLDGLPVSGPICVAALGWDYLAYVQAPIVAMLAIVAYRVWETTRG